MIVWGGYMMKIDDITNDIENKSIDDLIFQISMLSNVDRSDILNNGNVCARLRVALLDYAKNDQWRGYREMFDFFSISELLSLYDISFLENYFKNNGGDISIFFAALCEKDINCVFKYALNDEKLFEKILELSDRFFSFFWNLNYENFKEIIFKMEKNGFLHNYLFMSYINFDNLKGILKENISDDTLVYILKKCNNPILLQDFFKDDRRAEYLFTRFDIVHLTKSGVNFNDSIVMKRDFFDSLKSTSFITFRSNINIIEEHCNPIFIEEKLNKYYEEIISSYDNETNIFKTYREILNSPESLNNYMDSSKRTFILDDELFYYFSKLFADSSNMESDLLSNEMVISELERYTGWKLSEVIVDAIFRDNLYNVWINIKEMLRYNSKLSLEDRVIDDDRISFYNMILDIDKVSNGDKVSLYNKMKDMNFNVIFYDDLRKLKDVSYDNIKENLFKICDHSDWINESISKEHGVCVYDLRGKDYTMLVSARKGYTSQSKRRRACYSIISNDNSVVYDGEILYGYSSFENDTVLHMLEQDSFSSDYAEHNNCYVNRIMTSEELVRSSHWYSEIQLVNYKDEYGNFITKKPDFIVVFDEINNKELEESKRLNIPIVVINKVVLDEDRKIDIGFDIERDRYVDRSYVEEEMRNSRR